MALGEMALLRTHSLPVVVIVFDDGALDLIRSDQRRAGKAVFGTEFANPDFVALAGAYGLDAYRAASEAACAEALTAALANGRPALIDAVIIP